MKGPSGDAFESGRMLALKTSEGCKDINGLLREYYRTFVDAIIDRCFFLNIEERERERESEGSFGLLRVCGTCMPVI